MPSAVHQVLGVYADRDAVGRHALVLREALRRRGVTSEIFAEAGEIGAADQVLPLSHLEHRPAEPGIVLVYQAASATRAAAVVAGRPEPLVVNYHNVTPAEFFRPWEPDVARQLTEARTQVASLATRTTLAVADSGYNARDLREWGYRRVSVVPCLIDTDRLDLTGGEPVLPSSRGTCWLFVGRLAPNKAQHEIVKAFKVYRDVYDRAAVLVLAGRSSSHRYETALRAFIQALGLEEAVLLSGSVPDGQLGAYYRDADVFVCLSRHEGFCNTVIEAMAADLPVVSIGAAALPATIRDAGVVLPADASPAHVAAAVRRVVTDDALRGELVARGRRRKAALAVGPVVAALCDELMAVA